VAHSLQTLNAAVDARVARGDYRGALEFPRLFAARAADTASALLVEINLAEAEYNLGCAGARRGIACAGSIRWRRRFPSRERGSRSSARGSPRMTG
jgi:hypothetical protein